MLYEGVDAEVASLIPRESELGVCHNDPNHLNWMLSKADNESLTLLDYEATEWAPVAFNVAGYIWLAMSDVSLH